MKFIVSMLLTLSFVFTLTACVSNPSDVQSPGVSSVVDSSSAAESMNSSEGQSGESSALEESLASSDLESLAEEPSQTETENSPAAKSAAPVHHEDNSAQSPNIPEAQGQQEPTAPAPSSSASQHIISFDPITSAPSSSSTPVGSSRPSSSAADSISPAPSGMAEQVAQLVNEERSKAGLAPLSFDTQLSEDALVRAKEIVGTFDHTRPDGSSFSTAVTISWNTVGENIAWGQSSPQSVMNTWMNSTGHRQNILNSSFTKIGVGVTEYNGRLYWVQLFVG